jgi:predicted ribosomally synthesized peptide with nif11-like leader
MLSKSVQAFVDRVAVSPELQTKLHNLSSPLDFLSLAKSEGFDLTMPDFQAIAQQAYQQWSEKLQPQNRDFFSQVHHTKELDDQLKTCKSSNDVILLAHQCGLQLSEDDLQQAAIEAETIPGFSFEKLWFRGLGLIS